MLSLEGRVFIITGAGRGLGLSYVRMLASRRASIVVNDLGTDNDGAGADDRLAQEAADDASRLGARAIADATDIAQQDAGDILVDKALCAYGRVDAVINNAGIVGTTPFEDTTLEQYRRFWNVHVAGPINLTRAAWPHFKKQKSGRVVMTESSAGLYGMDGVAPYAAAKGAVHGLMRTLALEGKPHGIWVNAIAPSGYSRMVDAALTDDVQVQWMRDHMPAELVAPVVVWLASAECDVTGEVFVACGGRVARVVIGGGKGYVDPQLTPEKIVANYTRVASKDGFFEPLDSMDHINRLIRHK